MTSSEQTSESKDISKMTKEDTSTQTNNTVNTAAGDRPYVNSLSNMFYDTVDGVNYLCFNDYGKFKQKLPIVLGLDLRCDDVIACGFPKSGNHWLFEVLTMILRQKTDYNERMFHTNLLEFMNPDIQKVINAIESPRSLHSHLRYHRLPSQVVEKRLKMVYIVRNPKDVAVSMYSMFISFPSQHLKYNENFDDFFDLYLKGEFFWGHWYDHILSYEQFINDNPGHPVFILSYEKMKQQPVKMIRKLCAFLEKPKSLAEDIARATDFSNIKSTIMNGKMKIDKKVLDVDFIFRKGEIGDWKNWLSSDQSEAVNKLFEEKMAGSKLADLVREYI